MFGCTGPGTKRVEMFGPANLHSVLLLSGPAISMFMCVYVRVRERESVRV